MAAGDFNFSEFMKGFDKVKVKEEPIDELPAVNSNSTLASVKPRLSSSNESIKPSLNRDPRLKNLAMNPATSAKRSAFLSSTLKAPELTRTTARSTLNTDEQIKNIQMKTKEMRKLIAEPSTSFYSNIPAAPFAPSRSLESRSPVISNNHSARFISHATSENIHDALEGRNRNISSEVQITAQRVGADLDAISKRIRSQVSDSQTTYTLNTRSITTQTNADTETGVTSVPQTNKIFATVGTQTTKNDGVLTIWNVKDLTDIQRKALLEFKKILNIQDDRSTDGILERIQHRQADKAFKNNNDRRQPNSNSSYDRKDCAGSSREFSIDQFCNPSPPQHKSRYQSDPKRSKYLDVRPE